MLDKILTVQYYARDSQAFGGRGLVDIRGSLFNGWGTGGTLKVVAFELVAV